ncbi:unnamed protein product, partial [Ixodes pacificus]
KASGDASGLIVSKRSSSSSKRPSTTGSIGITVAAGGTAHTVWMVGIGAAMIMFGGDVLGVAGFTGAGATGLGGGVSAGDRASSGSSSLGVRGPLGRTWTWGRANSGESQYQSSSAWGGGERGGGVHGGVLGGVRGRSCGGGETGRGGGGDAGRRGSRTRIMPSLLPLL